MSKTANDDSSTINVRVTGTGPLSFNVRPGEILTVKEFAPSTKRRPSIAGGFKAKGYLLFSGQTKVGRLSPAALKKLGEQVPATCKAVQVNKERRILTVEFST